ncbi:adenosylhomocysteinase [Mycobacterium sp. NBC_00419]|uniref:adenosylhomocysteinase n=1 Tax=Mycobacterium sp. NBC_00419 TaxID=2975989 RepID=UPI002E1A6146
MTAGTITDPGLWRSGQDKIDWAKQFMPVTAALGTQFRTAGIVDGVRIGLSLVLEPKTANLALVLAEAGADVTVFCEGASTRDDVAAALFRSGIAVFARSDADHATDHALALGFLDRRHRILVDDGAHLIELAHAERGQVLQDVLAASEETTSGLWAVRAMEEAQTLRIPVIAANDAKCKTLFDNGYGTGQSCVLTIQDLLDEPLAGKSVVVAGYGHVGRGVARAASALGGVVTVTEVDPVAALEALYAGFGVAPLVDAVAGADLVISATGIARTVALEHLLVLRRGAAVAVAGGVQDEIAVADALGSGATRRALGERIDALVLPNGNEVVILDDGSCINCTAGEGNPIEIMDLSFGIQLSAVEYIARHGAELGPGLHALPASADHRVAELKLASRGVRIDNDGSRR